MTNIPEQPACTEVAAGALLLPYALGTLSAEETRQFEEHLLLCPACQRELEQAADLLQTLSVSREEIVELLQRQGHSFASGISPATVELSSVEGNVNRRSRRVWWLAAALLSVAAVITVLVWPSQRPELSVTEPPAPPLVRDTSVVVMPPVPEPATQADAHLASLATRAKLPYALVTPRSGEVEPDAEFQDAMRFYLADSLKIAQLQLQGVTRKVPERVEVWLYLGVTAYLNGDLNLAERSLREGLARNPRTTQRQQFRWYLANLKLREGQADEAKALLSQIIEENTALVSEARSLLAAISS